MRNQKEILNKKLRLKRYVKVGIGIYLLIVLATVMFSFSKIGSLKYSWERLLLDSVTLSQNLFVFWGPGLCSLFIFNNALLNGISSRVKYLAKIVLSVAGCAALSAFFNQCLLWYERFIVHNKLYEISEGADSYFKLMFIAIPFLIAIVYLLIGIISLAFIKVNKPELPEDF